MKAYKASAAAANTDITSTYIFIDDDIAAGDFDLKQEWGFNFSRADDIIYFWDDALDSSFYRNAPQMRYNGGTTTYMLEYVTVLIENYWGSLTHFKELDTVYHQSTVLSNTALINGQQVNITSEVVVDGQTETTAILSDSPFQYTIMSSTTGKSLTITFPVLPSDAIVDGKLVMTTSMKYSMMTLRIYFGTGFDEWGVSAYVGLNQNIPQRWLDAVNNVPVDDADDDPYAGDDGPVDPSGPGGGGGNADNEDPDSDPNPVPSLPTLSAVDTGFITLYNPSLYQLRQLAAYMWGSFDLSTFKKLFADPMECILGLSIIPVSIASGSSQAVKVGNISTGVTMSVAASQYVEVDCGTITINEKWHSYLDYSPYTKISIFLPFIGSRELDIDLVVGSSLGVVYHIDILSGGCVAFVTVNGNVRYEFPGQCAMSIPITSRDFTQTIQALCQVSAAVVGGVMSGGLSAPVSAASIAGGATAAANTAVNVASSKPRIEKSGNIGGSNAIIGSRIPYIIIERPKLCAPAEQNKYTGYPSYITYTLSELTGFTQIQTVYLNVACTDSERNEIMNLLREGVIL